MKEYRILIEVDRNGNEMESVAILDVKNNKIVEWKGNVWDAVAWVDGHGKMAT